MAMVLKQPLKQTFVYLENVTGLPPVNGLHHFFLTPPAWFFCCIPLDLWTTWMCRPVGKWFRFHIWPITHIYILYNYIKYLDIWTITVPWSRTWYTSSGHPYQRNWNIVVDLEIPSDYWLMVIPQWLNLIQVLDHLAWLGINIYIFPQSGAPKG